jgi:uncharacterized spore protein YtfJ
MSISGKSDIGVLLESVPGLIDKIKNMKGKKDKVKDNTDTDTADESVGSVEIEVEGQ